MMIRIALLLCLAAIPAFGTREKALELRYSTDNSTYGSTSYMPMPTTVTEATERGWEKVEGPSVPEGYEILELWCPVGDKTVCLHMDDTGCIAGTQIALDPSRLETIVFDWDVAGFIDWFVIENDVTVTYKACRVYYLSVDDLQKSKDERIAARDPKYLVQGDLFIEGFNSTLMKIPKSTEELVATTKFNEEACMEGMGDHYAYNLSRDMECSQDTALKWYILAFDGEVCGVEFIYLSTYSSEDKTDYFEWIDPDLIQVLAPRAPDCFIDIGTNIGLFAMHAYFVKDAYEMTCPTSSS